MMLETMGIETDDAQIAREIKLPWLFAKAGDAFLSGPMLQGKPLAGGTSLAQGFSTLQQDFMRFLRSPRTNTLSAFLSLETLHALSEKYVQQIENQLVFCS